ncbi:hypothetical protein B0H17DRAFT_1132914 [Mycena rosella]|uniref:Uncharacterized protein n=1 Tax=Mycena rosella TaxID=1033263 RepID=A0AAD7DLH3_MYCRO|nr:hypothetical protein B0H17DRAFT_1132914 [Mycena rosella]
MFRPSSIIIIALSVALFASTGVFPQYFAPLSLTFTPNTSIGPNAAEYLSGMTGVFSDEVQSQIDSKIAVPTAAGPVAISTTQKMTNAEAKAVTTKATCTSMSASASGSTSKAAKATFSSEGSAALLVVRAQRFQVGIVMAAPAALMDAIML